MLLLGTLALGACVAEPDYYTTPGVYGGAYGTVQPPGASPYAAPSPLAEQPGAPAEPTSALGRVAILLPLSGPNGERAAGLLKAAQLALEAPGGPALDIKDTGGTPDGAAAAAQQAAAARDGLILGPLSAGETAAAAGPARAAGIPVLAFTSDPAQARPGVWTLGLTPVQQVRRLVIAAQRQGRTRFAALLPDDEFGHAMANALNEAAGPLGLQPPKVSIYTGGMAGMNPAVRDLADYADRRGPLDEQIRAARARGDAEGNQEAAELARRSVPPPPFDALLLADTGEKLAELGTLLPYYDIRSPSEVRILGPALWAAPQARRGAGALLEGAWYAAPDPSARGGFEQRYSQKYGTPPPPLSDLAYDAASIARVVAQQGGGVAGSLTRPQGFLGADGVFALQPDGHVRRGLAVFEIQHGTPTVIEPAPQSLANSGA